MTPVGQTALIVMDYRTTTSNHISINELSLYTDDRQLVKQSTVRYNNQVYRYQYVKAKPQMQNIIDGSILIGAPVIQKRQLASPFKPGACVKYSIEVPFDYTRPVQNTNLNVIEKLVLFLENKSIIIDK
jgi:hypothetical protein